MKAFVVDIRRDGKWWMVHIPEIDGLTQARRLAEAEQMAAEYIAVDQDLRPSAVRTKVRSIEVGGRDIYEARRHLVVARICAKEAEADAVRRTSELVDELVSHDVPLRDIAEVVGVSYQRVHQIAKSPGSRHEVRERGLIS